MNNDPTATDEPTAMPDSEPASGFRQWLERRSRTVMFVSASLVLITYFVKDVFRESEKDFLDTVESAQTVYQIRREVLDSSSALGALVSDQLVATNGHASGAPSSQVEAYRLLNYYDWEIDEVRRSTANIESLNEKLDPLYQTPGIDALLNQLDADGVELNQARALVQPENAADGKFAEKYRAVTAHITDLFVDANGKAETVLTKAKSEADARESTYRWVTRISIALYVVGFGIGLVGRIYGVDAGISGE